MIRTREEKLRMAEAAVVKAAVRWYESQTTDGCSLKQLNAGYFGLLGAVRAWTRVKGKR